MPSPEGWFPVLLECGEGGRGQREGRPPPLKGDWATILDVVDGLLWRRKREHDGLAP